MACTITTGPAHPTAAGTRGRPRRGDLLLGLGRRRTLRRGQHPARRPGRAGRPGRGPGRDGTVPGRGPPGAVAAPAAAGRRRPGRAGTPRQRPCAARKRRQRLDRHRRRPPVRGNAAGQLGRAGRRRRRPHRPGDLRGPGPGAPGVAHPAGGQRRHGGPMPAHRHTAEAPHHRGARRAAELGSDRAALFRAVLPVLGHRRLHRPGRSRRHDRAGGRRLPAGQPAARRRAPASGRGLALPAHDTALLQPALPPGGGDPRIRLPRPGRPGRGGAAGRSAARRQPLHRAAGPELQLRGQTGCPGAAVRRPARPRPLARVR